MAAIYTHHLLGERSARMRLLMHRGTRRDGGGTGETCGAGTAAQEACSATLLSTGWPRHRKQRKYTGTFQNKRQVQIFFNLELLFLAFNTFIYPPRPGRSPSGEV